MSDITTPRLTIKPTHTNCWAIYDNFDQQLVGKLFFRNQWFNIILKPQSLHLGVASEASYHLLKALNSPKYKAKTELPHAQQFLHDLGFVDEGEFFAATAQTLKYPDLGEQLTQQFGLDSKQLAQPLHHTAVQLEDVGKDCFDRPAKLHPKAKQAWLNMQQAALKDDIDLQLVSAYRSLKYQADLLQNKIDIGQSIEEILTVNAAPGHSEHHTGCAIDINTPDFQPLETEFEKSPAYTWLTQHAHEYSFQLSYPKDNPHGIDYEPWHWCYHQK